MPQSWMPQSAEPVWKPSSAEAITTTTPTPKKKSIFTSAKDWYDSLPDPIHRFFTGPTDKDIEDYKKQGLSGEIQGPGLMKIPGLSSATDKLANYITGSEGNTRLALGALTKGIGDSLESGFDPRTAMPKAVPRIDPAKVEAANAATKEARLAVGLDKPDRLALPAVGETATKPRIFYNGPAGTADSSITNKFELGPNPRDIRLNKLGTLTPTDLGEKITVPPEIAAKYGDKAGQIPQIDISSPEGFNKSLERLKSGTPMQMAKRPDKLPVDYKSTPGSDTFIGDINIDSNARPFGSTKNKITGEWERRPIPEQKSNAQTLPTANATSGIGKTTNSAIETTASNPTAPNNIKDAISRWAYKLQGARLRGSIYGKSLNNLTEDQVKKAVAEHQAVFEKKANDELYQYLVDNNHVAPPKNPTKVPKDVDYFKFINPSSPEAKEFRKLTDNVKGNLFGDGSPEWIKKIANATSFTKNLYLGSGIPKTPLNMHMYNITRSNIMARGIKQGFGDFFSGVFHPSKDIAAIEKHANSGMLTALVDHGMQWQNIEDHAALFSPEGKITSTIDKLTDMQQKIFEDPLFKIHLPKVKLEFANSRVQELLKNGVNRDTALTQAAHEANEFYGGINKVLRNKTYSDLARIGLLAPDWLESRAKLAYKGGLSLLGKEDPLYRKALLRGAGMRVTGGAATTALTGYALNKSKRATNSTDIPAGKTSSDLNRDIPIYGSAVEGLKIPEEILSGRDPGEILTSRISQPAKSVAHIVGNEDSFGNPIRGNDKYGRPISKAKATWNTAKEVAAPIQPPWLVMLEQLLSGQDPERAIANGLELPLKYNSEPKDKKRDLRIR
jgi:hypothetical protein